MTSNMRIPRSTLRMLTSSLSFIHMVQHMALLSAADWLARRRHLQSRIWPTSPPTQSTSPGRSIARAMVTCRNPGRHGNISKMEHSSSPSMALWRMHVGPKCKNSLPNVHATFHPNGRSRCATTTTQALTWLANSISSLRRPCATPSTRG